MRYPDNTFNTSSMQQCIPIKRISPERGLSDGTNSKIKTSMAIGILHVENYFFEASYLTNR